MTDIYLSMLSEGEKIFTIDGVHSNLRNDGRHNDGLRSMTIDFDKVLTANGSCHIHTVDTDLTAAVKLEFVTDLPLYKEKTGQNKGRKLPTAAFMKKKQAGDVDTVFGGRLIEVTVDLSPQALTGSSIRSDELQTRLSHLFTELLNESVDRKQLLVGVEGVSNQDSVETCAWRIAVDVLVQRMNGSLFEAVSVAVKGALACTKFPHVKLVVDDDNITEDVDEGGALVSTGTPIDFELVSDNILDARRLDVSKVPLVCCVARLARSNTIEPTLEELMCSGGRIVVAGHLSRASGSLVACRLLKEGAASLLVANVLEMIKLAEAGLTQMEDCLNGVLERYFS